MKITRKPQEIVVSLKYSCIVCLLLLFLSQQSCKPDQEGEPPKATESGSTETELFNTAVRYYANDSVVQAHEYIQEALLKSKENGNRDIEIQSTIMLGYIYVYWNDYESSLKIFLESLSIARSGKDPNHLLGSLHGLGRTYNLMKDTSKALTVLQEALDICIKNKMLKNAAKMHLELGNTYTEMEQHEQALVHLEKAYELSTQEKDTLSLIYILNNIGQSYNKIGNRARALEYLEKSLAFNNSRMDAQAASAINGNIGDAYIGMGEYATAIEYINRSLEISQRQGFRVFTKDNYLLLSRAYELNQQLQEALRYHKRYTELGDSLFNEDKSRAIEAITNKFSQEEKDKRIAALEQQSKSRTIFLRLTIIAVVLALIVLILMIISIRLRSKLHNKEKSELGETISHKNRELVSMMMQTNQKHKMLEELEKTLERLTSSGMKEMKGFAEELKGKIKSTQDIDSDWQVLKTHFEEVHPDFFKTLQKRHPELSQNDLKLCAYIKINLSTKDIARLFNISDRSVQTAKYRIKKKMSLPSGIDLIQYIVDI